MPAALFAQPATAKRKRLSKDGGDGLSHADFISFGKSQAIRNLWAEYTGTLRQRNRQNASWLGQGPAATHSDAAGGAERVPRTTHELVWSEKTAPQKTVPGCPRAAQQKNVAHKGIPSPCQIWDERCRHRRRVGRGRAPEPEEIWLEVGT